MKSVEIKTKKTFQAMTTILMSKIVNTQQRTFTFKYVTAPICLLRCDIMFFTCRQICGLVGRKRETVEKAITPFNLMTNTKKHTHPLRIRPIDNQCVLPFRSKSRKRNCKSQRNYRVCVTTVSYVPCNNNERC